MLQLLTHRVNRKINLRRGHFATHQIQRLEAELQLQECGLSQIAANVVKIVHPTTPDSQLRTRAGPAQPGQGKAV